MIYVIYSPKLEVLIKQLEEHAWIKCNLVLYTVFYNHNLYSYNFVRI